MNATELERWIREELTVAVESELAKHKDKVKDFIKLTRDGDVVVINPGTLTEKDKVALYLIGKLYANYAKYSQEKTAANKELVNALNMPEGTVKSSLHNLREENLIVSQKGVHRMKYENIGNVLNTITEKVSANQGR